MTVTLDLWTKKHKLYYVGLIITVITLSFVAAADFFNLQYKSPLDPLYDTILIICVLISVVFIFIIIAGWGYLKDGELVLAGNYLKIDAVNLPVNEIKYINLKMSPRNRKSFVLDKNLITIGDKSGNEYKRRFVIKSYNQSQEVENIITTWRTQGIATYIL